MVADSEYREWTHSCCSRCHLKHKLELLARKSAAALQTSTTSLWAMGFWAWAFGHGQMMMVIAGRWVVSYLWSIS